jgi:hypothetical protein
VLAGAVAERRIAPVSTTALHGATAEAVLAAWDTGSPAVLPPARGDLARE